MLTRNRHIRSVVAGRHGPWRKSSPRRPPSPGWAVAIHPSLARWSPSALGDAACASTIHCARARWLAGISQRAATIGRGGPHRGKLARPSNQCLTNFFVGISGQGPIALQVPPQRSGDNPNKRCTGSRFVLPSLCYGGLSVRWAVSRGGGWPTTLTGATPRKPHVWWLAATRRGVSGTN
jgi:hypothetical protein